MMDLIGVDGISVPEPSLEDADRVSTVKAGHWLNKGVLHSHTPEFYQDHTAGTFHDLNAGEHLIKLPGDAIGILKLKI